MDNNTLLTLVCILIAVIALLVCISLFFIYTLEEKNAHQRHVIDVLLSTIKKLKVQNDNSMKHTHLIPSLLLALTLISCTHRQQPVRDRSDLAGAWVLRHVEYPSGTEEGYSMQGDGTSCLIYDHENRLYACNISTTPTGLLVKPTAATTVTLVDKGGGEWLYLEDGDPHPLRVTDSTITIQRMGILYTYASADGLYSEWGDDIRDIIDSQPAGPDPANDQKYVLSVRERQLANYIYWLVTLIAIVIIFAVANHIVNRRRRQQLQLQLRQIQEVQENRPPTVRQAAKSVEDAFLASDEYAALGRRMATGSLMKAEEWQQVEHSLKTVYPGFTAQLQSLYPMSDVEYHTCLLIKLRIPTKDIVAVLAREANTISSLRKRLYKKVFDREGGAKDWDDFILSIGT
ncbi:MAG: hypothetical protein II864_12225 [Prevotella sp.]|nr:hypothetical protein [Prevotella sp.]